MSGAGYEREIVFAFLDLLGEKRHDGQFAFVNEVRCSESNRETLKRWATKDIIQLASVDEFLMKHDLMTWELEDWARQCYGRDGFVNPNIEPAELVW